MKNRFSRLPPWRQDAKNRFSRLPPWRQSWIFCWNDFSSFFTYQSPQCFLPSLKSVGLSVQEKKWKTYFQDNRHDGHLWFPIKMILAVFDLPVTPMFPTKFQVSWTFGSGEEAKNIFSRWPMLPTKFRVKLRFGLGEEKRWKKFSYFRSTSHPDASH